MKKLILSIIMISGLVFTMNAQTLTKQQQDRVKETVKTNSAKLHLTAEQAATLEKTLLACIAEQNQMAKNEPNAEKQKAQMMTIQAKYQDQFAACLTPEQKAEMKKNMKEQQAIRANQAKAPVKPATTAKPGPSVKH
jgi:Spy/CpxP family protein refolding chaperone